jgi:hypothetical protein
MCCNSKNYRYHIGVKLKSSFNHSLNFSSLDLDKVMAGRNQFTFRVQGTCMYPCLRPGDVLHIESRTGNQVNIGEIAVCRRSGFLFGHRTIAKGVASDRPFIVTRPDRSTQGDDGLTYDEDLLGIVTVIERNGRHVDLHRPSFCWPIRAYLSIRIFLLDCLAVGRAWLLESVGYVQRNFIYRYVTQLWFVARRKKFSYVIHFPFNDGNSLGLYRFLPLEQFDATKLAWQDRSINYWTLALHICGSRRPVAQATFVLRHPDCPLTGWCVDDMKIRARYRGAGLEETLLSKAEEIISLTGMPLHRRKA